MDRLLYELPLKPFNLAKFECEGASRALRHEKTGWWVLANDGAPMLTQEEDPKNPMWDFLEAYTDAIEQLSNDWL